MLFNLYMWSQSERNFCSWDEKFQDIELTLDFDSQSLLEFPLSCLKCEKYRSFSKLFYALLKHLFDADKSMTTRRLDVVKITLNYNNYATQRRQQQQQQNSHLK